MVPLVEEKADIDGTFLEDIAIFLWVHQSVILCFTAKTDSNIAFKEIVGWVRKDLTPIMYLK